MSSSKMDLSLDQIIKLQKSGKGGNRGRPTRNVGRFNQRGASTSFSSSVGRRGGGPGRRGGGPGRLNSGRGNRPAVSTGFKTRRALQTPAGRRLAQNLVKRAMIQSRRQAISQRRDVLNGSMDNINGGPTRTQRLVNAVRKWKNTAHVLQNVLQQQQRSNIRPRRGNTQRQRGLGFRTGGRGIRRSLQNRLGWRQNDMVNAVSQSVLSSPGRFRKRRGGGGNSTNSPFGQMQSDLMSREEARQQRLVADLLSRAMVTASVGNNPGQSRGGRGRRGRASIRASPVRRNTRFGQGFGGNRSQNFGGNSNFGGRGRNNGRFNQRYFDNDSSNNSFDYKNMRSVTLNERFGGGNRQGPKSNAFRGGRGSRRGGRFLQRY